MPEKKDFGAMDAGRRETAGKGDKGEGLIGTAAQQAKQAASSALEQAKQFGSAASEAAGQAKDKAQEWASSTGSRVTGAIGGAKETVGHGMESLAGKIREKAPESGILGSAASTVANQIEAAGGYLREHDFSEMAGDVTGVVRRYPVQSVLIAAGIGFLLARATTSSRA